VTGSGWEAGLLSSQLFANLGGSRHKGVPILALGAWTEAAPDFLLGEIYIDLSQPDQFEDQYTHLLRRLTGQTSQAPPMGPLPTDLQPEAVEPLRGGTPAPVAEAASAQAAATGDMRLHFQVETGGNGEAGAALNPTISLTVDGGDPVTTEVRLDRVQEEGSQTGREVRAIQEGRCTSDDIQSLGSDLWIKLLEGPLMEAVDTARRECRSRDGAVLQLRLALPDAFAGLPWEALYDFEEAALATSPATTVVRTLHDGEPQPKARDAEPGAPLRMLVVIPGLVAKEVSTEWEKVQQSVRAAGDRVEMTLLEGPVTVDRFTTTLRQGWDILHFLGDGEVEETGRLKLRFDSEGEEAEQWLPAPLFAQQLLRSAVQLVVVNCRHGDSGRGNTGNAAKVPAALSGLGAYLLKARVPAAVVMHYRIEDRVVADFSRAFYHELLSGPHAGRVDLAMQEGRSTLLRNHSDGRTARSYISPGLYLAPGRERLFELTARQIRTGVVMAHQEVDPGIPEKLIYAFETGRCLPILGPGILGTGSVEDPARVLGPRSLARKLGEDSAFPDHQRLTELLDSSGAWLTSVILERICQHFECEALGERFELQEAVSHFYRDLEPTPDVLEMAAWEVPGMVYTHVDSLLERALYQLRGRNLRVVQAETLEGTSTPAPDDVVLLNLRGTYTNPNSLTLTERDQDRVLDRIHEIASFVEDLMNARPGCSLLYLGVSPRDPLVRALSRRLLRTEVARNRGAAYFVHNDIHKVETAYWRFERMEWVELDVETVIRGLTLVGARQTARAGGAR
jgi:hypothetical protein